MKKPFNHLGCEIRSIGARIASDREQLVDALEWLARKLTEQAGQLKDDPDRRPDVSIMSTSLVHTIEQTASRLHTLMEVGQELRCAVKADEDDKAVAQ